jgi:ABC-type transport system involved in Fe-S cluster assembly fused permease/ATPase subunit
LFDRWRARLAQALLRDPAVVLIDRDAEAFVHRTERDDAFATAGEKLV